PKNIREAAKLAAYLASLSPKRYVPHSSIPLILHQTWKTTRAEEWPSLMIDCVAEWLHALRSEPAAYFLWDDDGMQEVITYHWPDWVNGYLNLPKNVMRADVFRIFALRWYGGVYTDTDTKPLRPLSQWISIDDVAPWTSRDQKFAPTLPIELLVGIEADTLPNSDAYWRMGYGHPVELTQWALAGAAGHPALITMLNSVRTAADVLATEGALVKADALALTGPYRWTDTVINYLKDVPDFEWNSLSGLTDQGRSKGVKDVLVLPITGFSPGRSKGYGNMGSKPISHPDARLVHLASGTWKSFSMRTELVKACKSLLAMCKDWSIVP
ncbi:nucleotide-diphospho-sugar transferase, partial [Gaertneriomyces semiglobifer]